MNCKLQVLIGALNKIPQASFAMQGLIPTMRLPAVKETVQKVFIENCLIHIYNSANYSTCALWSRFWMKRTTRKFVSLRKISKWDIVSMRSTVAYHLFFQNNLGPELQKKLWMKWLFSKNYVSVFVNVIDLHRVHNLLTQDSNKRDDSWWSPSIDRSPTGGKRWSTCGIVIPSFDQMSDVPIFASDRPRLFRCCSIQWIMHVPCCLFHFF